MAAGSLCCRAERRHRLLPVAMGLQDEPIPRRRSPSRGVASGSGGHPLVVLYTRLSYGFLSFISPPSCGHILTAHETSHLSHRGDNTANLGCAPCARAIQQQPIPLRLHRAGTLRSPLQLTVLTSCVGDRRNASRTPPSHHRLPQIHPRISYPCSLESLPGPFDVRYVPRANPSGGYPSSSTLPTSTRLLPHGL